MSSIPVNDVYPTIQGEGCQTGVAMVLIRLQGCPVGCPWCDTKETWEIDRGNLVPTIAEALGATPQWVEMSPSEINAYVRETHPGPKWALITGGEPGFHDLRGLVAALHDGGYMVAVETSATAAGVVSCKADWITVSPKLDMPGGMKLLPQVLAEAHEIKMPVGKKQDIEKLDGLLTTHARTLRTGVEVCLQPISQSDKATALCMETVLARGWRLSVQTHKYIQAR